MAPSRYRQAALKAVKMLESPASAVGECKAKCQGCQSRKPMTTFETKVAIAVAEDLPQWQKLNVVAFLTSGVLSNDSTATGEDYRDASDTTYLPLCIQPIVILKANREKLATFLSRANSRGVRAAIYIQDMFETGHDAANRATVANYASDDLPLVGLGLRAGRRDVDKILKGAKLHD